MEIIVFISTILSIIFTMSRTGRILNGGGLFFILSNIIVITLTLMSVFLKKRKLIINTNVLMILQLILMTMLIRIFIQFEIACLENDTFSSAKEIFTTTLVQSMGIFIGFLIGYLAKESLFKLISISSVIVLPLCEITTTFGTKINGSRCVLNLGPFSVISLTIFTGLLPFCIGFLLEADPFNKSIGWKKIDLKAKHFIIIIYSTLTASMLVFNKDLGTFLVFGCCIFLVLLPTLRISYQIFFSVTGIIGLTFLTSSSHTFQSRVSDLLLNIADSDTEYLIQSYIRSGFWGQGEFTTSLSRFPFQSSDYALQVIWSNHGLIIAIGVVFLLASITLTLLRMQKSLHFSRYFDTFTASVIIVFSVPFVYTTACALLVVPVTGIPLPLIGKGSSLTLVYTLLITMVNGIYHRIAEKEN